jgi:cytochrome c-type biogenesis protein CcmF
VLTSVHAFATDPRRGIFILGLLGSVIGGSLLLYAVRAPTLRPTGTFAPISREGALVLNNLLLATACLTVFLGTLLPLFLDVVHGPKVSVGAPYYNWTFVPIMLPMLIAMGFGPLLTWKRAELPAVMAKLKLAAAVTVVIALATAFVVHGRTVLAPVGLGIAAWVFAATLTEFMLRVRPGRGALTRFRRLPRSAIGMTIAHIGMAVTIAGITVSTGWRAEGIGEVKPGEALTVAGETYHFAGVTQVEGPNYASDRATVTVSRDGVPIAVMHPAEKFYPLQRQTVADVAIDTNGLADRYVVLGEKQKNGSWIMRIYYNPLVPWVWIGALFMAIGGLVSLSDRRLRIAAPRRRSVAVPEMHVAA